MRCIRSSVWRWLLAAPVVVSLWSCSSGSADSNLVEATSLLDVELVRPTLSADRQHELEQDLEDARVRHLRQPDEMAAIWHGRRLGYLGRYREAIAVYGQALEEFPDSYRLRRHRGHRYLTIRELELAEEDLRVASKLAESFDDQLEEDGAPNSAGVPRSTTHSNIEYHRGLGLFVQGRWQEALPVWQRCLEFSRINDDMFVAAAYWNVLTHWRLGQDDQASKLLAEIREQMDLLENHDYHALLRLFQGSLSEAEILERQGEGALENATLGFGLGAWHLHHGRESRALEIFEEVVAGSFWPAFGCLASEAELARHQD